MAENSGEGYFQEQDWLSLGFLVIINNSPEASSGKFSGHVEVGRGGRWSSSHDRTIVIAGKATMSVHFFVTAGF